MANPNAAQDARCGNVLMTLCGSEGLMKEFSGYCASIVPHKRNIYHYPNGAGNVHYFTLSANKAHTVLKRIYSNATVGLARKMDEFSHIGGDAI